MGRWLVVAMVFGGEESAVRTKDHDPGPGPGTRQALKFTIVGRAPDDDVSSRIADRIALQASIVMDSKGARRAIRQGLYASEIYQSHASNGFVAQFQVRP